MPQIDLYALSPNPSPEQLVDACKQFFRLIQTSGSNAPHPTELLGVAEHLAEQIIGHYGGLDLVSKELAGFINEGARLPAEVLYTFLYASSREHESLGLMLKEIHSLYGDGKDRRVSNSMRVALDSAWLMLIPRPKLWGEGGVMKHEPDVFSLIHGRTLTKELADFFNQGVEGVQKVLGDYPLMNEVSQRLVDKELCKLVYQSILEGEDPIRDVLKDKLDEGMEACLKIRRLLENTIVQEGEREAALRLSQSLVIIDQLSPKQLESVTKYLHRMMEDWIDNPEDVADPFTYDLRSATMVAKLFSRLEARGFDVIGAAGRCYSPDQNRLDRARMVSNMIVQVEESELGELRCNEAMLRFVLMGVGERILLEMNLSEKDLASLLKIRGDSPGIRHQLLKSEQGRESVFCSELGL